MNAEIISVELTKTKDGARAVKIGFHTAGVVEGAKNEYFRDFIGEKAPPRVSEKYWALLDITKGWSGFASEEAYDLIGLKVDITTEDGDYGPKVTDIRKAGLATIEPPDDDIPF